MPLELNSMAVFLYYIIPLTLKQQFSFIKQSFSQLGLGLSVNSVCASSRYQLSSTKKDKKLFFSHYTSTIRRSFWTCTFGSLIKQTRIFSCGCVADNAYFRCAGNQLGIQQDHPRLKNDLRQKLSITKKRIGI